MLVKTLHPNRFSAAFFAVLFWAVIVVTGIRLPLLRTEFSFTIRAFVLFPALLLILWYALFRHRWRAMPDSLYRMRIKKTAEHSERIKAMLMTIASALFVAGGLSWTSIAFTGWATELLASNHYSRVYRIDDITYKSGAKWSALFDLHLIDSHGSEVTLLLNRADYEQNHWKSDEKICVIGRTWGLGTIMSETTRMLDRCSH